MAFLTAASVQLDQKEKNHDDDNAATNQDEMTEDARDNINMNESDAVWDTGRCELSLKSELKIIFERELPNKGYGKCHAWLKNHVVSTGVGNLSQMGERNFRDWMKGKRVAKRGVKGCNLRAFEDFVSRHKSGAKGVCDCFIEK